MEVHIEEEFHVNIDCDNVIDLNGNLKVWETLHAKVGRRTELFHMYRGKGRDGGVTGRIGCSCSSFVRSTATTSRSMALDTKTWT